MWHKSSYIELQYVYSFPYEVLTDYVQVSNYNSYKDARQP